MSDNIQVINLSTYVEPEIVEDSREDWVLWGEDHSYFDYLIDCYRKSTTNNAIINNIARLAYGRGLFATDAKFRPGDYANLLAVVDSHTLRSVLFEAKQAGNAAFQILYNKAHTKILQAKYIPVKQLAAGKCNKEGEIDHYWYSDNWQDIDEFPPKRINAFGTSKDEVEILYIKPFSVGLKYYALPDYEGALPYCTIEEEIADFLINTVQNSFSGTKIVNFNNDIPDIEEQKARAKEIKKKLSGSKGDKVIVSFNSSEATKTTIEDVPLDDAPEHYQYVSTEAQQKILNAHNVISPMIVGIVTENNGFSSNADEIEVASKYFYNIAVRPIQDLVIEAIDKIMAFNGVSLDLYFRRLNYLDSIEEKEQQKESVSMSSQIDEYLNKFGEVIDEKEWKLILEEDVEYDNETFLDSQVHALNDKMKVELGKKPVLQRLASVIKGNPSANSSQDKEVDGFFFKVRYKYTGSTNGEREFCNKMVSASRDGKVYRKEDIENMDSNVVNPGQGHKGQSYNLFLYKGGVNCHHVWRRVTYVAASKADRVGDADVVQVSNAQARKYGFDVANPTEVSTEPRYMKDNGHHPDYGK